VAHDAASTKQMQLPVLVFGIVEVRRLKRELEMLQDFVRQAEIREPGKQATMPRVSRLLDALATDNNLQLLQEAHRDQLQKFLMVVEKEAPKIHMSFAIDPSSAFTSKMVTWLRANIHPFILLDVGLQPTIAAGCVVRTPNKVFDFSLREHFADASGLLMKSLEAVAASAVPTDVAVAATPAPTPQVTATAPATPAAAAPTPAPAAPVAPAPEASVPAAPTPATEPTPAPAPEAVVVEPAVTSYVPPVTPENSGHLLPGQAPAPNAQPAPQEVQA
jgi:F0F1-type ATP synthase delta subunit